MENGNTKSHAVTSAEIQDIKKLVIAANERKPLCLSESGGPRVMRVFNPDGGFTDHELRNERKHEIENISDLCEVTKRVGTQATVWHDDRKIKACFDDGERFDTATMELDQDDRFAALVNLSAGPKSMNHETFIELLRVRMDGAVEPNLVELFTKISTNGSGSSEAAVARQSISRSAMVAAGVNTDIPSEITFKTPVYSEAQIENQPVASIRCLIQINALEAKFALRPIKRDIELAWINAGRHINGVLKGLLKDATNVVGIYQGRP